MYALTASPVSRAVEPRQAGKYGETSEAVQVLSVLNPIK